MAQKPNEEFCLITPDQLEGAVEKGVDRALTRLGIDVSQPFERQKDFAHLNKHRLEAEDTRKQVRGHIVRKATDVGLMGFVIGIWQYFVNGGPPPGQ